MLFQIALRNLFAYRKKSLAALLSTLIAFLTLALFEGYLNDLKQLYDVMFAKRQMLGHIIIERQGTLTPGKATMGSDALNKSEQEWIESQIKAEEVKAHGSFLNLNGVIGNSQSRVLYIGQAYEPGEAVILRSPEYAWNVEGGEPLDKASKAEPLLLGKEMAAVLGCQKTAEGKVECPGEFLLEVNTEKGQANVREMFASGLTSFGITEMDARYLAMPLKIAQSLYATNKVSYMTVMLNDARQVDAWIGRFNANAARDGIKVHAQTWQSHNFGDLYTQSMNFLSVFRNLVISIIFVVVSITAINTFVKIVNERRREIGTLRAIGYKPRQILLLFSGESALLGLTGSIFGLGCSLAAAAAINHAQITYKAGIMSEGVPFGIRIHALDCLAITGLIMLLTFIATMIPTLRCLKVEISSILHET